MKLFLSLLLSTSCAYISYAQSFTKSNTSGLTGTSRDWVSLALVDINNDQKLDLWAGDESGNHVFFYAIDSLMYSQQSLNITTSTSASFGSAWADIDNDCNIDVVFPTKNAFGLNKIYKNNGSSFSQITNGLLYLDTLRGIDAEWADVDNDGNLDFFIPQRGINNAPLDNFLYLNQGGFNFLKVDTGDIVLDSAFSFSANFEDYNSDGLIDLFVANRQNQANHLYLNTGNGVFKRDTASIIELDLDQSSCGTWGDYNNDGAPDLFVANINGQNNRLYRNNGNGTFTKILTGTIVNDQENSLSAQWGDFDNDGYLDLYVVNALSSGNTNSLYHNNGNNSFTKITTGPIYNENKRTYALATGDLNKDGHLDIINANRFNSTLSVFINNGGNNNFFRLNLLGSTSNKQGIGAKVVIKTSSGKQYRTVKNSNSLNSQSEITSHFGLASDTIIDSLWVFWPSGQTCSFANINVNGEFNVAEFNCAIDTLIRANFSDSATFLTSRFTQLSTGSISSYEWDFGDGQTSTSQNPVHHYAAAGSYLVTLITHDNYCKWDSIKKVIEICPDTSRLGFSYSAYSKELTFIDTSVIAGGFNHQWDFGDGTTDTGSSAIHTYSSTGTYTVCLTIEDSCRTKTICDTIQVCNDTLQANYSYSGTGFTIQFQDSSLNASSFYWDFGDGTTSYTQNPLHTFSKRGTYYVCLTIEDACTINTFCDSVTVCSQPVNADFTYSSSGNTFNFTNNSTNATAYTWDFDDGILSSQENPTHIYLGNGTYNVCLIAHGECFTDTICKTIFYCNNPGVAAFSYSKLQTVVNAIQFTDNSQNAVTRLWDFGDGQTSTSKNPTHIFLDSISYNVCLTITDSCLGTDSTCQIVDFNINLKEPYDIADLKVFPNPVKDNLTISFDNQLTDMHPLKLEIISIDGRTVLEKLIRISPHSTNYHLNIESLSKGIYQLHLKANDKIIAKEKVLKT